MKKVAFHTLGCKLNFAETSTIGKQFLDDGYQITDFNSPADVYVINTCTVTDGADKECRQIIRRAQRNNPDGFIIVTGCYAQLRSDEIVEIEGVDLVMGSNDKYDIISHINQTKNAYPDVYVTPFEEITEFHSSYSTDADSRTRAFLKIQDGCDYKCTYCTIPKARGKSRSATEAKLLTEFKQLLAKGYKEIILTGVNVGEYGRDTGTSLSELLKKFIAVEGEFRIRISSIEPNLLTDEIIELTASSDKLCNHFHIPLQSGSNVVLRNMKRRYMVKKFISRITKINETIPNAGIGIDVIVGFPGETDEEFEKTYQLLSELKYSYLHVFTYSERPNTEALKIADVVPVRTRKERNGKLRELSQEKLRKFHQSLESKTLSVLFEHTDYNGKMKGFASNYGRVITIFDSEKTNRLTNIKITDNSMFE
ncbi:MAG: tRNA (N(6)-L-threonylcarbamoyladenosine(37)-C(2))-methylthiotransferase MtaB [Rhodothermaceae bacterium]